MPIPAAFTFASEADFQNKFVAPLMLKLGFSTVVNYHGTRELGKDLVLGDRDRFGLPIYLGLQAKYEPSIGIGAKGIEDIFRDAEQAFDNPFKHPQTGKEDRISAFYAVNGGTFSDQAREWFFNKLKNHGDNVRLFDGIALLQMNTWATYSRNSYLKEQLTGLLLEITENAQILAQLQPAVEQYIFNNGGYPMIRCRQIAAGSFLTRPLMPHLIESVAVSNYYQYVNQFNSLLDSMGPCPPSMFGFNQSRLKAAREVGVELDRRGQHLIGTIIDALKSLDQT